MTAELRVEHDVCRSLKRLAVTGGGAVLLFAGTVGVWAITTTLSGAVVASGQFVVTGSVKKVQHPTGGIVGQLNVREGDKVESGAVVIRLDDTVTHANLQVVTKQLDELAARRGRLRAERDDQQVISIAAELADHTGQANIAELIAAEQRLFDARRAARSGQKAQLTRRVGQLRDEITGLRAQQIANGQQAELIREELSGVRDLYRQKLISISRKSVLEREAAELDGQKGQLQAAIAQAEGKIAETELQMIQIDDAVREEVMKQLQEAESKAAELMERRIAAEEELRRVEIRAPASGYVHQLVVHTVGGVLTPAEPAMLIVPVEDTLEIEARVNPPDIDQIAPGQSAHVKIHAFNQRTTPELAGTVSRIAADTSRDERTGAPFYTIRVRLPADELARIAPQRVAAGMQADVFVRTVDRTPLEYVVKPLLDQVAKAFRER
ncbi:HlyD family type I secretion periplasmic adaptor subunit [Ancylobacter defluvii]|uniref:Membrane fusion protein (MFP) family protein n=1 Tax=Ancylobacter defluvii TaxID=1282440 RepID=A0A9W6NB05_9HYPH|nr:HlyD family type I secretion periplasmic adaptor subunit [Ancylobacter defluvii]MBS7585820.1 HlyD family type I secretion periplasmic adaptor subunit [Ancylobacter defluvii]GLK84193.1 HlyD family type I secretion periplasmic adaptor subunit [Ancylobacter defluvii]